MESIPSESRPYSANTSLKLRYEENARFGFSARSTLALAQALYERHKVLTYPRTDARALPEDYLPTVRSTLQLFGGSGTPDESGRGKRKSAAKTESTPYAPFASEILKSNWVRPNKRIFDNSKIKTFVPGFKATIPFYEGVRRTLAWFDADPSRKVVDDAANATIDKIIEAYQRG